MSDWKNVQYKNGKMRTSEGGGGGSSTFAGLDDVSFDNIQNGQVPKYNSTTQKWENADESGGGGTVTDVQVDGTSVVNQQGVAEIEMPNVPVQDVQVDGTSVVNQQGVAEIIMPTPPTPDYPVTDVKVNGTSVVSNKQALITSYKEVTQAQYEALPDTKLNDNVLYAIKDGGQAVDGFPPLIYSDEEREVGVWRDGKPLYQKCFTNVAKDTQILSGVDTVVDFRVSSHGIGENADYHAIGDGFTMNSSKMFTLISGDVVFTSWTSAGTDMEKSADFIVVQYTKTADTPGSGTWTTQGTLAHHYSTDEHIIGTWIDGKPLYEKTYTGTTSDTITVLENSESHTKKIIDIKAATETPSTGHQYIPYYYSDSDQFRVFDNGSLIRLIVGSSYPPRPFNYKVVLQYTKTTD